MKVYRLDGRKPRFAFSFNHQSYAWGQLNIVNDQFYGESGTSDINYLKKIENGRDFAVHTNAAASPIIINRYFFDTDGSIYCLGFNRTGSGGGFVGKVDLGTGRVSLIAGSFTEDAADHDDNNGTLVRFGNLYDGFMAPNGSIYVLDADFDKVKLVQRSGRTRTIATGNIYYYGIVVDRNNNVFFTINNSIHKISSSGSETVLAGQSSAGYVDGTGPDAQFDFSTNSVPYMAIDPSGTVMYVMDANGVRRITDAGKVTTIAPRSIQVGGSFDGYPGGNIVVNNSGIPYAGYPDDFIP